MDNCSLPALPIVPAEICTHCFVALLLFQAEIVLAVKLSIRRKTVSGQKFLHFKVKCIHLVQFRSKMKVVGL